MCGSDREVAEFNREQNDYQEELKVDSFWFEACQQQAKSYLQTPEIVKTDFQPLVPSIAS